MKGLIKEIREEDTLKVTKGYLLKLYILQMQHPLMLL